MAPRTLNPTAASLLGFLHERPMSGWDLVVTAQTTIGDFWTVNRSQVYRELTAMSDAGLVEAGAPEARERRPFTITPAGRQAFADWIAREPGSETIRFPLLLTIAFGRHVPPRELARFIQTHRAAHAKRLAEYRELDDATDAEQEARDPFTTATLAFGIRYEEAVLRWFDDLPGDLRQP